MLNNWGNTLDTGIVKRLVDVGFGSVTALLARQGPQGKTPLKAGLANAVETDHVTNVHRRCLSSCCFAFRVARHSPGHR